MKISSVNIEGRKKLDMRPGDTVRVTLKVEDKGGKVRLQDFEGLVLARKHGTEPGATFTVRRVSGGYGVEKIFPLYSPMIEEIKIVKRSKVRRSKLYYIREKALKQISKRMRMMFVDIREEKEEPKEEVSDEENTETSTEETQEEVVEEEVAETIAEEPKEEEKEEEKTEEEK
jgi:large subunit ribosomal protein L19